MGVDRRRHGKWSDTSQALITELTDLVASTVPADDPRRLAEWAVTRWIITGRPIRECVAREWLSKEHWPGRSRPLLSGSDYPHRAAAGSGRLGRGPAAGTS
jgi:hypothetical protein